MDEIKRPGRPKKLDSEKVKYQLVAIYLSDYQKLIEFNNGKKKIAGIFGDMIHKYINHK